MNDADREDWVRNFEPMYNAWRASKLSLRVFVQQNRALIDESIAEEKRRTRPRS